MKNADVKIDMIFFFFIPYLLIVNFAMWRIKYLK